MGDTEIRDFRHFRGTAEVRVLPGEDGAPPRIAGRSIVFGVESENLGGFVEEIDPNARIEIVPDAVSLFNHDANMILGRAPGTLRTMRTADAINYEVDPPASRADVIEAIQRGDVRGNSFMFRVTDDRWERRGDGVEKRTILGMIVEEMGPVVFPAYPQTDVAFRSRDRFYANTDEERAGRRNSAADEKTIRSVIGGLRQHADDLEGLIEAASEPTDDGGDEGERAKPDAGERRRRELELLGLE